MSRLILLAVCLIPFLLSHTGCTKYIEKPTPFGQVAPPVPARAAGSDQNKPVQQNTETKAPAELSEPKRKFQSFMNSSIVEEFRYIYNKVGSPRMAIYLNRSLSDEVREWRTNDRMVVSVQGNALKHDETSSSSEDLKGISVYNQKHIQDSERSSPGESWMWRFEDGFLSPFIDIGANIVDRATIMRLTAASSGRQGEAYSPIAVKKIEMDSLVDKADLFIEILIRRDPGAQLGYEFKATAKEVNTGIIKANVTLKYQQDVPEKVVATDSGYHFVEDKEACRLLDLNIVASDLAMALMRSLTNNWKQ